MLKTAFYPLFILAASLLLFSCQKAEQVDKTNSFPAATGYNDGGGNTGRVGSSDSTCAPTTATLLAGQTINSGQVSVRNDADFIYVTYQTANGYTLTETHLYVGDCATIPVNNPGNPIPGQFPYQGSHSNTTSYTYQIPISVLNGASCGCVAAHAVVQKLDASGHVTDQQTGWGNGTRINLSGGNWGMKFGYCVCP
jgi:hypothetical protein